MVEVMGQRVPRIASRVVVVQAQARGVLVLMLLVQLLAMVVPPIYNRPMLVVPLEGVVEREAMKLGIAA
jgi:hypothetical protein